MTCENCTKPCQQLVTKQEVEKLLNNNRKPNANDNVGL